MKENIQAHGAFIGTLVHADGTVETYRKDNLILNGGIDSICNCLAATSQPSPFNYIAVGTGTTAAANTQTALVSELARKSATYAHTVGQSYFTVTTTFDPGSATGAITEAGVCNAATGGIFLDRVVFPVINKGENDTYTVTFKVTFTRG